MRRPEQHETLHGTRHGQLLIASELRDAYQLTEREAAVAALLSLGTPPARIASRLDISVSTCEKHLAAVRSKLGAETTTECVAALARHSATRESELPLWPAVPRGTANGVDADARDLADALRRADDLPGAIRALRAHLAGEGVLALYYVFLPQNAASFRRGDAIEHWEAPSPVVAAFQAAGGLGQSPIAARLFEEPDRHVLIDGTDPKRIHEKTGLRLPDALLAACDGAGFRHSVAFGSPFGCGFVGASIFFGSDPRGEGPGGLRARLQRLRFSVMLTQSSLFDYGLLARTLGLTQRERDALSVLAQGRDQSGVGDALGCGERAVSKILRSARLKLGAETNPEAIARAMSLNALVFL